MIVEVDANVKVLKVAAVADLPECPLVTIKDELPQNNSTDILLDNQEQLAPSQLLTLSQSLHDPQTLRIDGEPPQLQHGIEKESDVNIKVQNTFSLLNGKKPELTVELEGQVETLNEEVIALKWLLRRKEQEWDQILHLLKCKEEKLAKAERQLVLNSQLAKDFVLNARGHLNNSRNEDNAPISPVLVSSRTETIDDLLPKLIDNESLQNQLVNNFPLYSLPSSNTPSLDEKQGNNSLTDSPSNLSCTSPKSSRTTTKCDENGDQVISSDQVLNGRDSGLFLTDDSSDSKIVRLCHFCKSEEAKFVCFDCSQIPYCSKHCQKSDWEKHYVNCQKVR